MLSVFRQEFISGYNDSKYGESIQPMLTELKQKLKLVHQVSIL
jgi:hypothetical protein